MIWLAPGEPETIEATYVVSSETLRDGRASYDDAGRMASYDDLGTGVVANASLTWKYDAVGNIRNMNAAYKAINADGSFASGASTQSYWYMYDPLNRMVITKGVLNGAPGTGTITRGSEGSLIAYDAAGQRATMATGSSNKLETYSYNAMGYLTKVSIQINGGTVRDRATYARDLLGRVTDYVEYDNAGTLVHARGDVEYNKRDQVLLEKTRTKQGSDWIYSHTVNYYTETGAAMARPASIRETTDIGTSTGTILAFTETKYWKNGPTTPVYFVTDFSPADYAEPDSYVTNLYNWYDSAVQANIVYENRDGTTNAGYKYDANGSLYLVDQNGGTRPRDITFVTDAQGRVLERTEASSSSTNPRQRYYRFNGIDMGTIGNNGSDNVDFDASIALRTQAAPTNPGAFRGGATTGTPFADFDMSYDAINGTSEAMVASYYTVRNGDTLATIAQAVWGDASLWYMLAEANGLSGASGLVAGTGLIIPEKGSNFRNSADTFRPYDPQAAIGDTQPGAPKPPKQSNKCGTFGIILMIAVAVAVAAVVGPQVAAAFSTTVTTTATSAAIITTTGATIANTVVATYSTLSAAGAIAAGAVTAAAASVASQAFGAITGIQKNFSFKQVALSAISGGISAGIGQIPGLSGGGFANGAARGALSNAATQGISVATGLQNKFSWTGVAVGGVVGGVSSALDARFARTVPDRSIAQYAQQTLTGGAAAIAGAATRSLLDGSDFGDNLVAALPDVVGSTIGNMVANGVDSGVSGGGSSGNLEVDGFRIRQSDKASPFSAYALNASTALTEGLAWDGARRSSGGLNILKPLIDFTTDTVGRVSREANVRMLTEGSGWSFESVFDPTIVVNGWKRFTNFVSSLSSQQSADRITRSIMTTINRNVANPIKANITNIISKSVSTLQTVTNMVDNADPIKFTLTKTGHEKLAAAYQGLTKDAFRGFAMDSIQAISEAGNFVKNAVYSSITSPGDTFERTANWIRNEAPQLPGRIKDYVLAEAQQTYSQVTSGAPGEIQKGTAALGELFLSVAGPSALAKSRSVVNLSRSAAAERATGAFSPGVGNADGLGIFAGRQVAITPKGLDLVRGHLKQFGDVPANTAMIGRLESAMVSGQRVTGADAIFYTHEAAEATLMARGLGYDAAHAATLQKYSVSPFSVYHPEVIQAMPEAFNANWRAFWGIK